MVRDLNMSNDDVDTGLNTCFARLSERIRLVTRAQ